MDGRERVLRVLIGFPLDLYEQADASGGRVPWSWLAVMLGGGAASGGLGALIALGLSHAAGDGFLVGFIAWTGCLVALAVWTLLLIGFLHVQEARRERGPWLPLSLAGVLAIVAMFSLADGLSTRYHLRFYTGPLVVTGGRVLSIDEGSWPWQDRRLLVQFAVDGHPTTVSMKADDVDIDHGARVPDAGGTLQVEYPTGRPDRARPAGARAYDAGDADFFVWGGIGCAVAAAGVVLLHAVHRVRHPTTPGRHT